MSYECEKCFNHCLECTCELLCRRQENGRDIFVRDEFFEDECKHQVGTEFKMPFGGSIEIRTSGYIEEDLVDLEDVIDGIYYRVYWNGRFLPVTAPNRMVAYAMAIGCQWAAHQVYNERN